MAEDNIWGSACEWDPVLEALLPGFPGEVYAIARYQDPEGLVGAAMTGSDSLSAHLHAAANTQQLYTQAAYGTVLTTSGTVRVGDTTYTVTPGIPVRLCGSILQVSHLTAGPLGIHLVQCGRGLLAYFFDTSRGHEGLSTLQRALGVTQALHNVQPGKRLSR